MNDDEWHEKVEEHLLRDLIEDTQERVKEHDYILKGERGKTGLIAEYDRHDEKLTRLYAVIFQDPTGQKGLLHDVDYLMGRKAYRDGAKPYKWDFWKSIIVAIIMSGGISYLTSHWSQIKALLPKDHPDKVSQMIEKARNPKPRHRHIILRVQPSMDTEETSPPSE